MQFRKFVLLVTSSGTFPRHDLGDSPLFAALGRAGFDHLRDFWLVFTTCERTVGHQVQAYQTRYRMRLVAC